MGDCIKGVSYLFGIMGITLFMSTLVGRGYGYETSIGGIRRFLFWFV